MVKPGYRVNFGTGKECITVKNFVLAPDSFKGTLKAEQICKIEEGVIRQYVPNASIHSIPMADGGEGMVNSYLNLLGGERISVSVMGPSGDRILAEYGILPDGSAVMEMAAAAGLLLAGERKNPLRATTFGVGEMILDAERRGVKKILLGLGGSATNDCGIGMAAALGFRFLDGAGNVVVPQAENLGKIQKIVQPERRLDVELIAACDVDNPLTGPNGATYTFGRQKGADDDMLARLEAGMTAFEHVIETDLGVHLMEVPGVGAAGGMGAAVFAFFNGSLQAGIELLLDTAHFDEIIQTADMVFTGEGRIDWQSAHGKVPTGVGLRCMKYGVPCIALCGSVGEGAEAVYDKGITAIFSSVKGAAIFEDIQKSCEEDLLFLTDSVLRLLTIRHSKT